MISIITVAVWLGLVPVLYFLYKELKGLNWPISRSIKAIRHHLDGTIEVSYDFKTWEKWQGMTVNAAWVEHVKHFNEVAR